jgi:hypothetical protein
MVEPVDGYSPCFVVYVGWESLEVHDTYHRTKHFRMQAVILGENNPGFGSMVMSPSGTHVLGRRICRAEACVR